MRQKVILFIFLLYFTNSAQSDIQDLIERASNTSSVYLEGGLALMGAISIDVNEIDQFGYDVEDGYESWAASLRIGVGHHFRHFGLFCYGDYTKFLTGFFFYQRNPYSPAILRLHTDMIGYGLEMRILGALRFRAGYGQYGGSVEVGSEDNSTESWSTDIDEGSGFHWSTGIFMPLKENLMLGLEYTRHYYDIKPHATQTPAMVTDIHVSQWNFGLSLAINLVSIHWDD